MLRVVVVVVDLTMLPPAEVEKADTNEVAAGALVEERAADAKRRND